MTSAAIKRVVLSLLIAVAFAGWATAVPAQEPPPVRVGGNVKPPPKTKDAKPVYPAQAKLRRTQGVVIMDVTIGSDGKVKSVSVIKSLPGLDEAATDAVKQWEFMPPMLNGKAIPVIMTVALSFKLSS